MLAEPSREVLEIILEFLGISQRRDEPRHHLIAGDDHEDGDDKDVLAGGRKESDTQKILTLKRASSLRPSSCMTGQLSSLEFLASELAPKTKSGDNELVKSLK
jgi:hypothetical protein